jgi:hypothetical protein
VGSEEKEPLSDVRRPEFLRGEGARLYSKAEGSEVGDDLGESVADVARDVLAEDEGGLALGDDAGDVRPEMALVIDAALVSGDGERLAWVARSDEIHDSTPRASVEGSQVRPDRGRM